MTKGKKVGFVIYYRDLATCSELTDAELGKILRAVAVYAKTGSMPGLSKDLKGYAAGFKTQIDFDQQEWQKTYLARLKASERTNAMRWGTQEEQSQQLSVTDNDRPQPTLTDNDRPQPTVTALDNDNDIDKDIDIDKIVSKYVDNNSAPAPANLFNILGKKIYKTESYDDIMIDLQVEQSEKQVLFEFIKHCQMNGKKVINSKLVDIILRLDFAYPRDVASKIKSLKTAIAGGYFDIKELKPSEV